MQCAVAGEALDGGDAGSVLHDGQSQAGVDATAIEQNRAGPTLPVVTALFCSGQIETVAERVEQSRPGRDLELSFDAIDGQCDGNAVRGESFRVGSGPRAIFRHFLRSPLPWARSPVFPMLP